MACPLPPSKKCRQKKFNDSLDLLIDYRHVKDFIVKKDHAVEHRLKWALFRDYSLKDGIVHAHNAATGVLEKLAFDVYEAGEEGSLAVELARVNRPHGRGRGGDSGSSHERALLAFVQDFGPVGQIDPFEALRDTSSKTSLSLDHVQWCLAHASALDLLLSLCGALAHKRHDIIDCQLQNLFKANNSRRGLLLPRREQLVWMRLSLGETSTRQARVWSVVEQLINPNINGTREVRDGQTVVAFSRLFALAYSQVANWLTIGRFGQCDDCFSFFPMTDNRMRYCPPLGGATESRCALRDRARRRSVTAKRPKATHPGTKNLLLRQDAMHT